MAARTGRRSKFELFASQKPLTKILTIDSPCDSGIVTRGRGAMREKIFLSEDVVDIMIKMSEGNPGAATVLASLARLACGVVEEPPGRIVLMLLDLDDMNIRGEQIWVGFKDHCNSDIAWFKRAILARDPDMVDTINAACGGHGEKAVVHGGSLGNGIARRNSDSEGEK